MTGKRAYDDPCGIARALDVLGERWALLVVRELVLGPKRYTDIDPHTPGSITAHAPGYIDRDAELIVGLQTERRSSGRSCPTAAGAWSDQPRVLRLQADPAVEEIFTKYRKTHNDGVFDAYTAEIRAGRRRTSSPGCPTPTGAAASSATTVAWPSTAWTGSIADKERQGIARRHALDRGRHPRPRGAGRADPRAGRARRRWPRLRLRHLGPGRTASRRQWLYFGYLAAVKEQNGAAMSLGRVSTFLDIYLERDLDGGPDRPSTAPRSSIDDWCIKLRIVRFLRTPEYDALFSGDPTWVTECHRRHGRRRADRW